MKMPRHLARRESLRVLDQTHSMSDDGGVNEDYREVGRVRGTFVGFSRSWVVDERYGQGLAPNPSLFWLDLTTATVTLEIQTRLQRPDGTTWQITRFTYDGDVAQAYVEQV